MSSPNPFQKNETLKKEEEKSSPWRRATFLLIVVMGYALFFRYLVYKETHTPIPPPSEWQSHPASQSTPGVPQ